MVMAPVTRNAWKRAAPHTRKAPGCALPWLPMPNGRRQRRKEMERVNRSKVNMNDTQLPRYQVFLQTKPGEPYQDVGSVHAADAELALLNARDVFVRRPECHALWVVPVEAIFTQASGRTSEQFEDVDIEAGNPETYHVFYKPKPASALQQLGTVAARSPSEAMQKAQQAFAVRAFVWWVFPASQVSASSPADETSLFAPARTKGFRMSTDFHTLTAMRELMKERPGGKRE